MRFTRISGALALVAGAFFVSCSELPLSPVAARHSSVVTPPQVVISQVYGGGGLGGSQYLNDFVELFNRGTTTVDITGWSLQYASAPSTNWSLTTLSGSIAPGGYYLIKLASSLLGSVELPTPDATGTTNINASNGKIALVSSGTRIESGTDCPTGVVDFVAYGTPEAGVNCTDPTGTSLTASTAAIRLGEGCTHTGSNSADFTTGAPAPRNSASDTHPCGGAPANAPPVAALDGPYAGLEGTTSIAMSGVLSTDPDGTITTYAWDFGDGATGSGASVTHTYAQDGVYTVTLVVTDDGGLTNSIATTATVANVAPAITFSGAALRPGETYSTSGSFTDPGADGWSATIDFGDGSGPAALALNGNGFSLSHPYAASGSFSVTVTVSDDHVTVARTETVTVGMSMLQMIDRALALVDQLVAEGKLKANPFRNNLETAKKQVVRDKPGNAVPPLQNFLVELNAAVRSGRPTAQDADELLSLVNSILEAVLEERIAPATFTEL